MTVFHSILHPTPVLPHLTLRSADHTHLIIGVSISVLSTICALWHAVVLVAEVQCIQKYASFILISSQSFCDICALFVYFALGIEVCRCKVLLPARWSSFIFSTFQMIALPHYMAIAINRALAILAPVKMERIWTKRMGNSISRLLIGRRLTCGFAHLCEVQLRNVTTGDYRICAESQLLVQLNKAA
ncbi:unnamed protein product [Gongylonema pulchrum]|uniref:G_PROTEIN_RECEP_F1_2 domain-containing protein n=1 Tax=Gongylonema pulchrum TaxID=637853 RepID=A0A183DTD5_9BILA|nr:unnamed protein product [Gongylonema pulchrum]